MFRAAEQFFQSPTAFKENTKLTATSGNRGYVRLGGETLDPTKPADIKEAFNVGLELRADDPDVVARKPFRTVNLWPEVRGFRETILDYFDKCLRIGETLHRAFALDLGVEKNYFDDKFLKPMATLRLLHYPPVDGPVDEGQLGAGTHTDYGNVTLLATDAVGGLMIQDRSGRWLDAPVVPGAFVCRGLSHAFLNSA